MELIWHGHSCFSVTSDGYTVVFDPYADDEVPALGPLRLTANALLEPVTRLATNIWKVTKTAFPRVLVLRCPSF